ncbi:MAG: hypothetical protein M3680_11065 [Myxococcota bacterium]|nr:hypothetical protein [Myxococcota bacterium]
MRDPLLFEPVPTASPPSPGLRRLLETKLDTFEKLELALVLRDAPDRTGALAELARQLQVGVDVLKRVATELVRVDLVDLRADDTLHLIAGARELELIGEGAALYAQDRQEVIILLSTIAMARIRSLAARSFADAFNLRKKKKDGDG